MKNKELIEGVAKRSGIPPEVCGKVIDALEETIAEGISEKKWKSNVFETLLMMMNNIKTKR